MQGLDTAQCLQSIWTQAKGLHLQQQLGQFITSLLSASAMFFFILLSFCHSLMSMVMKNQCSQPLLELIHHRATLETSWLNHRVYTSAATPTPKSLCVRQPAGPPLLSSHAAIPGGSWPSSLKYVLLSLGHQSVTWMASSLRQGLHSCFLLSG